MGLLLPLLWTLSGLLIGSFLATVVIRLGDGRSPWIGRSACDDCGKTLQAFDLFPVLSYIFARGRARCCGARIDPLHPVIEVVSAATMAASYYWLGDQAWLGALFGLLLLLLAALDLRYLWLPDLLTGSLAALGLSVSLVDPAPDFWVRIAGLLVGFSALWLVATFYRHARGQEGLGAGDPKLLGAIGAWTGWQPIPWVILTAALIGLLWAAFDYARHRQIDAQTKLPFGLFLAMAAWPIWLIQHSGAADILAL